MLMTVASQVTGVKLFFTHDTETSLNAAVELINSEYEGGLDDLADLDEFVAKWNWTGSRRRTHAELEAVQALRPRLRQVWFEDEDGAVAIVNRLLREASALPQLVKHDDLD